MSPHPGFSDSGQRALPSHRALVVWSSKTENPELEARFLTRGEGPSGKRENRRTGRKSPGRGRAGFSVPEPPTGWPPTSLGFQHGNDQIKGCLQRNFILNLAARKQLGPTDGPTRQNQMGRPAPRLGVGG